MLHLEVGRLHQEPGRAVWLRLFAFLPSPVSDKVLAATLYSYSQENWPGNMLTFPTTSDFALYNFRDRHVYTAEMKKRIERRLKDDMMAVCEEKGWFRRRACKGVAKWYAWVVKKWPRNKPTDDDGWPGWVN